MGFMDSLRQTATNQDWFAQNAPQAGGSPTGAVDPNGWQQVYNEYRGSHPATAANVTELYNTLKGKGYNVAQVPHGGGFSADKLMINGSMYDLGSGLDNPNGPGSWWDNPSPIPGEGNTPGGNPGFTGQDPLTSLQNSPGYQFRLNEGQQGLERSAAAKGTLLTGGTLKGIARYNQDYASGEFNNRVGQLGQLASLGYPK